MRKRLIWEILYSLLVDPSAIELPAGPPGSVHPSQSEAWGLCTVHCQQVSTLHYYEIVLEARIHCGPHSFEPYLVSMSLTDFGILHLVED